MPIDLRRADPDRPWQIPALVTTLGAVFVFLAVGVVADWAWLADLDQSVADAAFEISSGSTTLVKILEIIAVVFGNWPAAALLTGLAVWSFLQRERLMTIWIVLSALIVLLGNPLLKLLFDRDRPFWDEPLYEIGGLSFPSGHAAGAGLVFTIAALITIVLTGRGWRRRALLTGWVALMLLVAADRVLLGVHFLSDVLAGLAWGSFVPVLLWYLIVRGRGPSPKPLAVITGSGRRRSAVVLNPAKVGDVEDFKERVRTVAALHGWREPLWFETTIEDPGHGQTVAALASDIDLIIAAGGDGTVRAVCDKAARSGVAVGILPHGTGNLLARNLDIPLNTRDALDVVFSGQDRAIDLAEFRTDGSIDSSFLVMAGLGLDAAIMSGVNDELKSKVGYLAYFVSGVRAVTFPATKVTITIDGGEPHHFRARTVVVGNVGFLQGGIPLLPDAEIDDGLLDVVVVAPKRFIGWLAIVARVITRRPHNNERLTRLSGAHVVVTSEKSVPMQLDGDPIGEGTRIDATVRHGVLLVRVPAELPPAE